jgi:hypothetical protein
MFRFTIRDLLWLRVLVALGVGWRLDRHNLNKTHATDLSREKAQYNRDFEKWLWSGSLGQHAEHYC